jgi:hypothetical protein
MTAMLWTLIGLLGATLLAFVAITFQLVSALGGKIKALGSRIDALAEKLDRHIERHPT